MPGTPSRHLPLAATSASKWISSTVMMPLRGTWNGSDCPLCVTPSTTQVARARTRPKFVGTFCNDHVPSGRTWVTRFRTAITQFSSNGGGGGVRKLSVGRFRKTVPLEPVGNRRGILCRNDLLLRQHCYMRL